MFFYDVISFDLEGKHQRKFSHSFSLLFSGNLVIVEHEHSMCNMHEIIMFKNELNLFQQWLIIINNPQPIIIYLTIY